jgi:hypothetical protein
MRVAAVLDQREAERLSLRRIRDLLRLTFESGLSSRQVSASLGLSKSAENMFRRRAHEPFAFATWSRYILPIRSSTVRALLAVL